MAANKFATMVHNNTNKITLVLIYAMLEWMLIFFLLLNSVFSYLIIKFAEFFGLNPPCFSCARIDRFSYHLCEFHSKEISSFGFCSNHKKLAEFDDLCENCSSCVTGFRRKPTNFVFSKVERIDVVQIDEEKKLKCSCCQVNFDKKIVDESSCFVVHPIGDVVDNEKKVTHVDDCVENMFPDDRIESGYVEINQEIESEKHSTKDEEFDTEDLHLNSFEKDLVQIEKGEDLHSQDLKFFIHYSGNQFFPFELHDSKAEELDEVRELIDLKTEENRHNLEDEDHEFGDFQKANLISIENVDSDHRKTEDLSKFIVNLIDFGSEEVVISQEAQASSIESEDFQDSDSDLHSIHEDDHVSIGTEIPVLDSFDEIRYEEPSTNYDIFHPNLEIDFEEAREDENDEDVEEERAPETPSSHHSRNPLHKKWLMFETKEVGVEDSFDGSVISESDGGDLVNTSEKLKLALKAERKALQDLYSELEEERNASMVAANETMAMINRLQEEKAAMQMEALQYQRMMEEQSEYDQEALQLLNDLMMKKEKELELYRKKVLEYEAKEKTRVARMSTRTGTSSISWSHSEDEDGMSIDSVQVPKDENTFDSNREIQGQDTSVGNVLDLESSLAVFEEERVSILEQLRVLEEKLFALSDEEDRHFANISIIEDHYEEINTFGFNGQITESTTNGFGINGKQPTGKRLLPLLDVISNTKEDGVTVRNGYENGFYSAKFEDTAVTRFELEKKRIDMEEEVDQLYTRLQALEADREFLNHCIKSMKKGDKGMELLQEILHHLKDLRDVNLRAKNYTENALL
ncbi:Zein-binding domain-containing protein [Artemisia annua]|uniref:Zein-binding domain-containing protein n=1 Tax=Artemisia annua TaxID=35608 RepID=A0A2U1NSB5_ARTAN|nr:Zein-binding domain-containing protein [Artemisia annua]